VHWLRMVTSSFSVAVPAQLGGGRRLFAAFCGFTLLEFNLDLTIFSGLSQDGVTTGAIYALLALTLVLVFSVTRVIFVQLGEFVTYGALTYAALQSHKLPATAWLVFGLGVVAFAFNVVALVRGPHSAAAFRRKLLWNFVFDVLLPATTLAVVWSLHKTTTSVMVQIVLTMLVVTPLGRFTYRLAYQRVAESSVLLLLIVSVAAHIALVGTGLAMFGPEGSRVPPIWEGSADIGPLSITGQSICILFTSALLMAGLYGFFSRTISGAALRATAINRVGAIIMGIETANAGVIAFVVAAGIGSLCGILIAPITTIYYDSGFLISLKGFVAAIFGGLASYPLAAAGALFVGLLESFASFWASAYKEVFVFILIIPVLLWLSLKHPQFDESEE
jgi:branched-chain amino acid transport system permease protein